VFPVEAQNMVVYIQKHLNIFVCIPSRAGAEGGVWWAGNRLWHAAPGPPPTCNFWLRPCTGM